MIPISILLLMALSAVLATWCFEHIRLMKEIKAVLLKADTVSKEWLENTKKVQVLYNEQAQTLIALGKKVEELSNKVEFSGLFKSGKMFNETRKE